LDEVTVCGWNVASQPGKLSPPWLSLWVDLVTTSKSRGVNKPTSHRGLTVLAGVLMSANDTGISAGLWPCV